MSGSIPIPPFLHHPILLKLLTFTNLLSITITLGCAISMSIFSIPVIKDAQSSSSRITLRQFDHLITNGTRYLQGGSRIQGVLLLVNTVLLYTHPDERLRALSIYIGAAGLVGAQVAWYEVVTVFPINDRLLALEKQLLGIEDKEKAANMDVALRPEISKLLDDWRYWHFGRIVIPAVAVGVMVTGLPL